MSRVDDFLQHYVEMPYDPVKAHEYYLKNRDLKGRTTSGMSDKQKEAWTYTKDRIANDKKKQVEVSKVANEKKIEVFRAASAATRQRITDKLKLFSQRLTNKSVNSRDIISDKLKADIANVAPIPKGVTGKQREILVAKRNKEIADLWDTASSERSNVTIDTKSSRVESKDTIIAERTKVGTDLKAVIAKTRDDYTKAKEKLNTSYEAIYAKEYRKVLDTISGKAASKGNVKGKKPKGKGKAKKPKVAKQGKIIYYTKSEMANNRKN